MAGLFLSLIIVKVMTIMIKTKNMYDTESKLKAMQTLSQGYTRNNVKL